MAFAMTQAPTRVVRGNGAAVKACASRYVCLGKRRPNSRRAILIEELAFSLSWSLVEERPKRRNSRLCRDHLHPPCAELRSRDHALRARACCRPRHAPRDLECDRRRCGVRSFARRPPSFLGSFSIGPNGRKRAVEISSFLPRSASVFAAEGRGRYALCA